MNHLDEEIQARIETNSPPFDNLSDNEILINTIIDTKNKEIKEAKKEVLEEACKRIEKIKDEVRKRHGTFKYDDCYDDCLKIIQSLIDKIWLN